MDIIIALLVAALGAVLLAVNMGRFRVAEQKAVWLCFVAHVVFAFVQIWVTANVLGGGDIFGYERRGSVIAELLRQDFSTYFPEVLALFFQSEQANLPFGMAIGSSTGSQNAVSGLLMFLCFNSFYAASVAISLMVCASQIAIYLGFREVIRPLYHRRLQLACLLVPSVLFWSSGMQKEAVAMAGLGWVFLASIRFAYGRLKFSHVVMAIFGAVLVAHSKAYILIALVPAAAAAFYWRRSQSTPGQNALVTKPLYLLVAIVIGTVGFIALGEAFPRFSLQNFAQEAANLQEVGQRTAGDSNIAMGDPTERTLAGQLAFAPLAGFTALFRPLIIEVHNVAAAVNGLETTAILIAVIAIFKARPVRRTIKLVMSSPPLMFCLVFTLIMSVGVGLTTTNLGTLSRYRMPMMPFYVMLLLLLLPVKKRPVSVKSPSRGKS